MAKDITGLEEYLLSQNVDITAHKVEITLDEERLHKAAKAWTSEEEGIRAVVENRMQKIRDRILLRAKPQELLVLREALVELAHIFDDFSTCTAEVARRAEEKRETEGEEPIVPIAEEAVQEESSVE